VNKTLFKYSFVAVGAALAMTAIAPVVAGAIESSNTTQESGKTRESSNQGSGKTRESLSTQESTEKQESEVERMTTQEHKEVTATRLSEAKQRVCQNHKTTIANSMTRVSERAQKRVGVIEQITERAKAFYAQKGKTLSNYDALVAEVATKKADAQAAVESLKAAAPTFDCSGDNPKGVVASFKERVQAVNKAFHAYRQAVKDLIVGIKSVQGTTSSSVNGDRK
jgi:hypothetical protein